MDYGLSTVFHFLSGAYSLPPKRCRVRERTSVDDTLLPYNIPFLLPLGGDGGDGL